MNLQDAAIKPRQTFSMAMFIVVLNAALDNRATILSGDVASVVLDI
ncbi:hypothetical protein [Pandoraea morbifera]|nr:hypothetical protein [Pandoraea morbifera]